MQPRLSGIKVRPDEQFVGECLVRYFGRQAHALAVAGEDPPDLRMTVGELQVAVEVTRLSQFTVHPNGAVGNRASEDTFAVDLINRLNTTVGPTLPEHIDLVICAEMPVRRPAKYKKALTRHIESICHSSTPNACYEFDVEGSRTRVRAIPRRHGCKRIVGLISNRFSSPDIAWNARVMLENRIRTKMKKCASIGGPVWLALLNDYWLADHATYAAAGREVSVRHRFDKLLLVSGNGAVSELPICRADQSCAE